MPLKDKIFPRVDVLKVSFGSSSSYTCELIRCKNSGDGFEAFEVVEGSDAEALLKKDRDVPYIIAYCGYGIIGKAKSDLPAKLLEKVTSGGEEFLWSEDSEGVITLLRREQAGEVEKSAAQSKCRVTGTLILTSDDTEEAVKAAGEWFGKLLTARRFLVPDSAGSALCGLLFDKLKLPVLALMLVLLTANYFRGERARAEVSRLQAETLAQQRATGTAGEKDRQKNALYEKYERRIPHGFAWISDRVAIVLPKTMLLTSLKLQPLEKKLENGKELPLAERRVEITGRATNTEDIMVYISALKRLEFAREVRMVSFEQDRNSSDLLFNLLLTL